MILPASKHPKKMMQSKEDQLIELKEIFWNNIKVGQWDFASGVLQNVKIISEKEYENLLVECILHPTTYCDGSLSLPSPIHLSYLAAQELIEYHGGDKRKISSIRPEVFLKIEFNLILHRLGDRAPLNLIKELSMYHQDLVLHDLGIVTQSTVNPLSPELCECISKLILTDPLLASILVKLMSGKTGVHQTNNLELQQLFCKQVSSLLSQLLQEADGNSFRETFDNLTSILAISQSYLSSDDELFVETCKHFYRKLLAMENQNYAQEFVISFLGETGDTSLLKMLQEYETDIRLESLNIGYSHTSYSFVETGKYIASKLEGGSAEQWMNMFLLCYKHKLHLLQCIVDACCLLVDEKRYEELTDILTFVKPLVPLILFLSWEKLPNFEDARMLLECLQNIMPNREFDGVLGNVCQQLEYQTNLIEWCLQKTREILGDEYDGDTIVDKLFQQIDSKSVLSVLSGAHLLKTLKYEEVMNLLEKKHHFDKSTKTSQFSEEDDFICYCVIKRYYHLILGENSGLITEDDGIQVPFSNELIKTYMLEIKQEISKLTSPLLKIEILENLFAMIFLRSTDLKHFRFTEDIDNDNLDAASINSSFTFGSVSPSTDSLSTIGEDQAEFKFSSSFKTNQERFMLENISKESKPSPVSTNTVLLQEIGESSSETLKATSGPCDEKLDEILSSSPRFLVSADILRETLYLIDECILQVKTFESLDDSVSNDVSAKSTGLKKRKSFLVQCVRGAQWRLELITGVQNQIQDLSDALRSPEGHIINRMLGSPKDLVYLTLKKGDVIQAKQVIKMYKVEDEKCLLEVSFMEELERVKSDLLKICKTQQKTVKADSKLSLIRSAAQAGMVSISATQIVEKLLQHPYLSQPDRKNPNFVVATILDLLFSVPINFDFCKTLLEHAQQKIVEDDDEENNEVELSKKIKSLKSLIHFITTEDANYFHLCGIELPQTMSSLIVSLPTSDISDDDLKFFNQKLWEGKNCFEDLYNHIEKLKSVGSISESDAAKTLKQKATNLFAVFKPETLKRLNTLISRDKVYNYMKSLWRYINKLADWRTGYDKDSKEILPEQINPFYLLSETLTVILGKLLFDLQMPPEKMETFTKQISVNIVNVIAENCGVKHPALRNQPANSKVKLLLKKSLILNKNGDCDIVPGKSANVVVEELLSNLIDMISDSQSYSPSSVTVSEVCQILNVAANELASVDMETMKAREEKLSFFINLFHLLYTHGLMVIVAEKLDENFRLSSSMLSKLLHSPSSRLVLQKLFQYQVGGIGIISTYDIYNALCGGRCGKFFGLAMKDNNYVAPILENLFDKRSIFVISHWTKADFQRIKVMTPETVEEELDKAMLEYLQNQIVIDDEKQEIFVPELLELHDALFTQDSTYEEDNKSVLLRVLLQYLPKERKKYLELALDESYDLNPKKHNWDLKSCLSQKSAHSNPEAVDDDNQFLLNLPDDISKFLYKRNPLAATVIELSITKNRLLKHTSVLFKDQLLLRDSNRADSVDIFSSLEFSLKDFTKLTSDSDYQPLHNFIIESCSVFSSYLKEIRDYKNRISHDLLGETHACVREIISKLILGTLSYNDWLLILPSLISCALACGTCNKLAVLYHDLIVSLPDHLFDMIIKFSIFEVQCKIENGGGDQQLELRQLLKDWLLQLRDRNIKYELLFDVSYLLDGCDTSHIIKECLMDVGYADDKKMYLKSRLKKICWLNKVHSVLRQQKKFSSWYVIETLIDESPTEIVHALVDSKSFELLNNWQEIYPMSLEHYVYFTQAKISQLLEEKSTCYYTLELALFDIKPEQVRLKICRDLVEGNDHTFTEKHILLLQYIIDSLSYLIDDKTLRKFMRHKIGILAIQLIPEDIRGHFYHLQKSPLVIVEQLLMNVKVAVAGKVIEILHKECKEHKLLSSLASECDDIIAQYATKSLFVPETVVPTQDTPSRAGSFSLKRTLSVLEDKPPERRDFIPPLQPVDKKYWIRDSTAATCMACEEEFNMLNRRHHCRHCGRVVCADCSRNYCYMPRYKRKERTCEQCYRANYAYPRRDSQVEGSPYAPSYLPLQHPLKHRSDNRELMWVFTNDPTSNKMIKEEFYFEQSPSAALCLSMMDLSSNQRAAGGMLLKFANNLSEYLQVDRRKEVDCTMIAGMITFLLTHAKFKFMNTGYDDGVEMCDIHIARVGVLELLLNNNWKDIPTMQELTRPEALKKLCDGLIEKEKYSLAIDVTRKCGIDVTGVYFAWGLATLKYGDFKQSREHLKKCLTVTNCEGNKAYNPNGHYLDSIIEIIEDTPLIAVKQVLSEVDGIRHMKHGAKSTPISDLLTDYYKMSSSDYGMDKKRYDEIMFYLTTYGDHGRVIGFFVRRRLFGKAIQFMKEKKCPQESFITQFLQPCFQTGCFDKMTEELRLSDPALRFWEPYLNESCKYLSQNGFFHCLYQMQLFIKDYYRAALTCVRFFLGTAGQKPTSFADMYRRIKYLRLANQHLESLIKERSKGSFVSHVGATFLGDDKHSSQDVPTGEVKFHASTINLQLKVMEYLHDNHYMEREQRENKKIPTLFGNGKERAELVIELLMMSAEGSLPVASRIIQEYKLPSSAIFGRSCKRLAELQEYDHVTTVLKNIEQNGMVSAKEKDDILLAVVKVIAQQGQAKVSNKFIKLIKLDTVKINALMNCGRLRDAYLEAIKKKEGASEIVQRILDQARILPNQQSMIDICEKWLKNYHIKQQVTVSDDGLTGEQSRQKPTQSQK